MAKKWKLPTEGKKAAKEKTQELPFEAPGEVVRKAKSALEERRPGAKIRLRGKAQGITEGGGDRSPNLGASTSATRAPDPLDPGEDAPEEATARPWPRGRQPYRGPDLREEDGIVQGAFAQDLPSRVKGRPAEADEPSPREKKGKAKRTREGERKDREERSGEETRKEERSGELVSYVPDHEKSAEKAVKAGANGLETSGSISPLNPAQESVSVAMTVQQRRPLPVLRDLGIVEAEEMKKVTRLPQYACSTCQIGPECPEYQEGYVCAFDEGFSAFPSRDVDSVLANMVEITDTNKRRLRMAYVNERIASGGMADPNVTRLSETVMAQMKGLLELQNEMTKVTVSVQGAPAHVASAVGGGEKGPGILSRLFGGSQRTTDVEMNSSSLPESRAADTRALNEPITVEAFSTPGEGQGVKRAEEESKGASGSETAGSGPTDFQPKLEG